MLCKRSYHPLLKGDEGGAKFGGGEWPKMAIFARGGHYPPSDDHRPSCRSDALYPALSGEWEVPVTRNAKITPVNEGGGGVARVRCGTGTLPR